NGIVYVNGICIDSEDNLYVAGANRIIKITPQGVASIFAGRIDSDYSLIDGAISEAKFYLINGITMDDYGNFYVTDKNSIRKIEKVD
ncbi:MAG TPA: hypothetical protein VHO68_07580, partial [Bacteroidales bacterium]|nr:hypothetical protein [Bacteroidales bacterium]